MTHQLTRKEKIIQQTAQSTKITTGKFRGGSEINKGFQGTKLQLVENPGAGDCGWYTLYHQLATYYPGILVEIAETIGLDCRQMNWHMIKAIVVGCLQNDSNPQLNDGEFFGLNLSMMRNARYAIGRVRVNYARPGEYLANSIFPLIAMLFNIGIVALYPEVMQDQTHYISNEHHIAKDAVHTVYLCHVNKRGHYVSFTGDQTLLQQDLKTYYEEENFTLETFYKFKLKDGTTSTNVLPYPGCTPPKTCIKSDPMNADDRKKAWVNGLEFFRKSYPKNIHTLAVATAFKASRNHAPAASNRAAAPRVHAGLYHDKNNAAGGGASKATVTPNPGNTPKTPQNIGPRLQASKQAATDRTSPKKVDAGCTGCVMM